MVKQAGCIRIGFGAESGSNRILEVLNKGTTVEMNTRAADMIIDSGMYLLLTFMIGVPSETENEMMDTFDFIKRYANQAYMGLGRFCALPGSPSYTTLVQEGKIDPNNVNWEQLSNISDNDGPYFAVPDEKRFKKILVLMKNYVYKESKMNFFIKNNYAKYPEIVRLYM